MTDSAQPKTILLVEDEGIIALSETRMLKKYGYNVVTVSSGERAVEIASTSPEVDLVLMDINLGYGMDGTRAAELILAQRDLPLVFMSSHTDRHVVEKTEGIASYGYVVKGSADTVINASIKIAFQLFEAKEKERQKEDELRESEAFSQSLIRSIPLAIAIVDEQGIILYADPTMEALIGKDSGGSFCWQKYKDNRQQCEHCPLQRSISIGESVVTESNGMFGGREYEIVHTGIRYRGRKAILETFQDITERKWAEKELQRANETLRAQLDEIRALQETLREQALHDPLTGLFNRRYLSETMEREFARAKRENNSLSFLMIDIDRFKVFNDTHGHQAGDEMLKVLGKFLLENNPRGDIVFRYGGEEFLVVLAGGQQTTIMQRADEVRQELSNLRIDFDGKSLSMTISIGIACYPEHGDEMEMIIRAADAALYQAKQAGRNCVRVWGK